MANYPKDLFQAYSVGLIGKSEFIMLFGNWQRKNGLDYSCKGTADKSGVYLTYRNITGQIKNGVLHFTTNQKDTARDPFEFRRKVDAYHLAMTKGARIWG